MAGEGMIEVNSNTKRARSLAAHDTSTAGAQTIDFPGFMRHAVIARFYLRQQCCTILSGPLRPGLKVTQDLINQVFAVAEIGADGCSNHPGPVITLGGTITLSSLHARLIFRNNFKGTHTAEVTRDVTLIGEGEQVTLPKQPSQGGVTGNPLISVQFVDGNGDPLSDSVLLGRCNQL